MNTNHKSIAPLAYEIAHRARLALEVNPVPMNPASDAVNEAALGAYHEVKGYFPSDLDDTTESNKAYVQVEDAVQILTTESRYLPAVMYVIKQARLTLSPRKMERLSAQAVLPGDVIPNFKRVVRDAALLGNFISDKRSSLPEGFVEQIVMLCDLFDWTPLPDKDCILLSTGVERLSDGQIEWMLPDGTLLVPAGGGRWHGRKQKWANNLSDLI